MTTLSMSNQRLHRQRLLGLCAAFIVTAALMLLVVLLSR